MKKKTKAGSELFSSNYRGEECLNCNHPLDRSDRYCPNCSQLNSTKKVTFKHLISEFFANLISYDSRFRKTLSILIFRPGRISKEYIQGKRLTYTNPFRFLLSLAIIYFIMLSFTSNLSELDRVNEPKDRNSVNFNELGVLAAEGRKNTNMTNIDSIRQNNRRLDSIRMLQPIIYFDSINKTNPMERFFAKIDLFRAGIEQNKFYTYDEALHTLKIESTFENKTAFSCARSIIKVSNQPGSFLNYLISKIPIIIFLFLPFFALFIWLIYNKKKYFYMDHLIFGFHNQAMFLLLLIVSLIIELIFKIELSGLFFLIFLIYLYKAMRNFYGQGRFKTVLKFIFLNSIFFILASFVMLMYSLVIVFIY